jgi:dTDP-4-dehydrorhamnose reductase
VILRILVTGASGMLGSCVVERFRTEHTVTGVDLPDGDLSLSAQASAIFSRVKPQWVIHCAAWTNVDGAESSQEEAMAANGTATANIVALCAEYGSGLTAISTDYVFDGNGVGYSEDEPINPVNYYGVTKAVAEKSIQTLATPWQIVRTSWLFGDGKVNFVKTIMRLLGERDTLRVVDDQTGCPTYTEDLADILFFLVAEKPRGIFHGTNSGSCSWFKFAREIARQVHADPDRILPCPSSEYPTPAKRPACSILLSEKLEQTGCPMRPSWQSAVARYVNFLESQGKV